MSRIDLKLEKPKRKSRAMGSGFVALDMIEGDRHQTFATGGTCGNVLAILAWLGWTSEPVARLGCDAAGEFIAEELRALGVDLRYVRYDAKTATPIVVQRSVVDKSGQRTHRFTLSCPECGHWLPRFRSIVREQARSVFAEAGPAPLAFFFDRVAPGILELARWARSEGAIVMFEPSSFSDEAGFREAVELAHVLKFSRERLGHVKDFGSTPYPDIVIETLGEAGLRIRWSGHWSEFEAFKAPRFVDAAGAGDWSSAGFLHVIAQDGAAGLSAASKAHVERAIRLGQALSALACSYEGARGLMSALSPAAVSKHLRSLAGGKGKLLELPGEAADRSGKPFSLCDVCGPRRKRSEPARRRA